MQFSTILHESSLGFSHIDNHNRPTAPSRDVSFRPPEMPRTLIAYSTTDGQTLAICRRLQMHIEAGGVTVTLLDLGAGQPCDLAPYDCVVIGASIRYGKYRPCIFEFVESNREFLERTPNAFFSVNVVARKPGKETPEANPYVRAFVERAKWTPKLAGVFAGKIDYPRYGYLDRQMIRFIMWLTHGPTDPTSCTEFTNWQAVEGFAREISGLSLSRTAAPAFDPA